MSGPSDDDLQVAEELAADLPLMEAIRFLHEETGFGLRYCHNWAIGITKRRPGSILAQSVQAREPQR